ncbi:MAG TPA: DNA-3-methyladenine glycosylase I, partial [Dehalococcoidia bacterium]|nr:DNA-3-methyladenine glycosylase I [Dehalococcoidia bacterium]
AWSSDDPLMVAYHDEDWGVPMHDDRQLFEMLTLEGAQAGLSWATILKRRNSYRAAFHEYDIERIAQYGQKDTQRLLADAGIIRNRAKVAATIKNAQATLDLQREGTSLDAFLWSFVGGATKVNRFRSMADIPAETDESTAMSKALKKRGFGFVGPTICYALMQSIGIVNDHSVDCFRHDQV